MKEQGYHVVLIDSNPAAIMTDPGFADATYIEPVAKGSILSVAKKERVDAILPAMGGQAALNVAMEVYESGFLGDMKSLSANPEAIEKGEDRQVFKRCTEKVGMNLSKSMYTYNCDEALRTVGEIGFSLAIRASCILGDTGSSMVYNTDEFEELTNTILTFSPIHEIPVEESLLG